MKLAVEHPGLSLGWVVHRFDAPQKMACFFGVVPFTFQPNEPAKVADEPVLPGGDRHVDDDPTKPLRQPSDFVPFKPRADVVVLATAHVPGGESARQIDVGFRVGSLSRTLRVTGKRLWKSGLLGRSADKPSEEFSSLPITYEQALGGPKSKFNPIGRGLEGEEMPRIEDPTQPIRSPQADLPPAGFGPLPASWQPRAGMLGTYGKAWRTERWPWLPADFDYAHFNAAPRSQQVDGYLRGDEPLEFTYLHPEHAVVKSRLPGQRLRIFVQVRVVGGDELREVPLNLDTLWIDVDAGRGVLVWRGRTPVSTVKMPEIEGVAAGLEPLGEPGKSPETYAALLASPEATVVAPTPPTPRVEPAFVAEMNRDFAAAADEVAEIEAEAEAMLQAEGIAAAPPPPPMNPDEMRSLFASSESLSAAQQADMAADFETLAKVDAEFDAMDAEFAARFPPPLGRDAVLAAAKARAPLGRVDLAGMDLSKQSLAGADFADVNLSGANLSGTDLSGGNFSNTNLAGADLTGCDLQRATLDGADLTGAQVEGANFAGASLRRATLAELSLVAADLSNINGEQADFARANLSKAKLTSARLVGADFTAATLEEADLQKAILTGALLNEAKAARAVFDDAELSDASCGAGADFAGARFHRVVARKAAFEKAILDGADFTRGRLAGTLFSEASLKGANFDRCDLTGVLFDDADLSECRLTNANLLRTAFDRAKLASADLRGSNAYEAGFWEADAAGARLNDVNLRGTLLG